MNEKKIKHLEMIQGVITRMASNSFMLKGWAVTLVAAVFALAAKDSKSLFFLIAYIPIIFFWGLDSYYFKLERQYRNLFDDVRGKSESTVDFAMKILPKHKNEETSFISSVLSPTEIWFYFPCAIIVAVVLLLIHIVK